MKNYHLVVTVILFVLNTPAILGQIPTATPIPGDSNLDGFIDEQDLILLERNWHSGIRPTMTPTITETYTPSSTGTQTSSPTATVTPTPTHTSFPTLLVSIPGLAENARPLRFIKIPAGSFEMGSPDTERGRWGTEEGPVHDVIITKEFFMGETEVTQAQWEAVMGSNPASGYGVGLDYPVYSVSWNDITKTNGFLERLDAETSFNGFRLPTEAEWEYACRAGTTTRFSFGDNLSCNDDCSMCSLANLYMWWCGNNTPNGTKPVHGKSPNPFGLYDIHGNVWEWCQDWFQSDFYSQPEATVNPICTNAASGRRVRRGGYCGENATYSRSAVRSRDLPQTGGIGVGFRIVLDSDIQTTPTPTASATVTEISLSSPTPTPTGNSTLDWTCPLDAVLCDALEGSTTGTTRGDIVFSPEGVYFPTGSDNVSYPLVLNSTQGMLQLDLLLLEGWESGYFLTDASVNPSYPSFVVKLNDDRSIDYRYHGTDTLTWYTLLTPAGAISEGEPCRLTLKWGLYGQRVLVNGEEVAAKAENNKPYGSPLPVTQITIGAANVTPIVTDACTHVRFSHLVIDD